MVRPAVTWRLIILLFHKKSMSGSWQPFKHISTGRQLRTYNWIGFSTEQCAFYQGELTLMGAAVFPSPMLGGFFSS